MSESIRRKPVTSVRAIKYSKVSSPPAVIDIVHPVAPAIRHHSDDLVSPISSHVASFHVLSAHPGRRPTTTNVTNCSNSSNHSLDDEAARSVQLTDPSVYVPSRKSTGRPKYVRWGVHWLLPTYLLLCVLAGIALALAHHFYYSSLSGSVAGSESRQQWAVTFGTSFAYLVVHVLGAAMVVAYGQYMWSLIRQRPYTLESLDKLFSMTSDPRSLLNWEILRHGKLAILMCLLVWGMGFASVTPPATLVVVPGSTNSTRPTSWPSLDWSLPGWIEDQTSAVPASSVLGVGALAAFGMQPTSITPPASNSSFHLSFYGPSLQCNAANSTQQSVFDYYKQSLANKSRLYTTDLWGEKNSPANWTYSPRQGLFDSFLVFSAFAPGERLWYASDAFSHVGPNLGMGTTASWVDRFGNWEVDLPEAFNNLTVFGNSTNSYITTQQFWILTSNENIVCILGNASYDVDVAYANGQQTISQSTKDFEPLYMPQTGTDFDDYQIFEEALGITVIPRVHHYIPLSTYSFMSVYTAFTSTLSGNVTLALWDNQTTPALNATDSTYSLSVAQQTSHVLSTALGACQDIVPSAWFETLDLTNQGLNFTDPAADRAFNKPSWMCRNQSIGAALEDLFQNITISMLTANIPGSKNQIIDVTYFPTRNIFHYKPRNLVISYSLAVTAAVICVIIGLAATVSNGVSHSSSFSSLLATAQNPRLRGLFEGSSLGALPLDREIRKVKLRFGELSQDNLIGQEQGDGARHVGFGFEDDVLNLRKNATYT